MEWTKRGNSCLSTPGNSRGEFTHEKEGTEADVNDKSDTGRNLDPLENAVRAIEISSILCCVLRKHRKRRCKQYRDYETDCSKENRQTQPQSLGDRIHDSYLQQECNRDRDVD